MIVTGYRADDVRLHADELSASQPHVRPQRQYRETNNISPWRSPSESITIDDDIILIESDLIYEAAVIRRIVAPQPNVALLDRYRSGMDGTVVTVEDGAFGTSSRRICRQARSTSTAYKTLNIYKFSKDFCNTVFSSCSPTMRGDRCQLLLRTDSRS